MSIVETVKGPIDTAQVGRTLMHEHIFVFSTEVAQNYPDDWGDEGKRIADAVARLNELKEHGIDTIVDLTAVGIGRFIPRIQCVARQVKLNIIVASGIYTYWGVPYCFTIRGPGTLLGGPEPMIDLLVRDIEVGIAGTGIKAGILKCATDEPGVTPGVERVLRAIAKAHRLTGVPISTHTDAATRRGLDQQRIFEEEGVDLSRVIIGHSGDSTDLGYLETLMSRGSYIGMDRFGIDSILPLADRVETLARLCERGWVKQMVLSHDAACYIDWFEGGTAGNFLPNWHYLHIPTAVIPALKERGVTDEQIKTMLVENPRRIFETRGTY